MITKEEVEKEQVKLKSGNKGYTTTIPLTNLKPSTGLSGGLRTVLNELVLGGLILIEAYYLIPFLIVLLSFPFFYLIYKLLIKRA